MDELRQVFSDKAEVSVIINENMPVMINFEPEEEGSKKIKNIIFNFGAFSFAIPDDSEISYSFKKALDFLYIGESSTFIDLDDLIARAKKRI